jgi:hypothetical protein
MKDNGTLRQLHEKYGLVYAYPKNALSK